MMILSGCGRQNEASEALYLIAYRNRIRRLNSYIRSDSSHGNPCDFAETVRWWTKNQTYSPEEISGFFFETTPVN